MGTRPLHVAILNIAAHGHVNPTLAVVEELVRRGHRVTYCVPRVMADKVAAAGADVIAVDLPSPEAGSTDLDIGPFEESIDPLPLYRAHFDTDPPDVVLHDMLARPPALALAHRYSVPLTTLCPTFASSAGFALLDEVSTRTGETLGDLTDRFRQRVARFLEDEQLSGVTVDDAVAMVPDRAIAFLPREFQPAADTFDDRYAFVGPCLSSRRRGGWSPPDPGRPVLLVSVGTILHLDPNLVEKYVAAFAGSGRHVVISTGHGYQHDPGLALPPNIEVHPQVPQLAVLGHADVMVGHAGMGGVMEALAHGVPMLTAPRTGEQEVVADRLAECGAGRPLGSVTDDPEKLRALVENTATDLGVAEHVQMLRAAIDRAGGATRAADVVEEHAGV